jgi:N-acetylglucosaminyl-diphospho-decaprenol L-rhamnosyltransferase
MAIQLSVVIVNWNAAALLRECLQSISEAASPFCCEVIVVDNASTDGSVELIRAAFPTARIVRNETNVGYGRGCDAGVRASHGDFVATINPDVVLGPDSLALLVRVLRSHRTAGLAGPQVVGADGNPQKSLIVRPDLKSAVLGLPGVAAAWKAIRPSQSGLLQCFSVNGCCMVFRREALERCGGFPTETFMYGEEIIVGERLRRAGYTVWHEPRATITHYGGASSAQQWSASEQGWRARIGMTAAAELILSPVTFWLWSLLQVLNAGLRSLAWVFVRRSRGLLYLRRARLHAAALYGRSWSTWV